MPIRLLVALAAAILPATGALLYVQVQLRHERVERIDQAALNQAFLLSANVGALIDGARQLTSAVARSHEAAGGECGPQLEALRRSLGGYAILAVFDGDDRVACSSAALGAFAMSTAWQADLAAARRSDQLTVGHYTALPAGSAAVPMFLPFTTAGGERRIMVAAVDLDRLADRIRRFLTHPRNSVTVADDRGTILVRLPDPRRWRGQPMVAAARSLVGAATAGTRDLTGLDGMPRRVGYVPAATGGGLYVADGIYVPDMLAPIDAATRRGTMLTAVGAALSLILMLGIARRLVHRPTEALLKAAASWTSGDLAARARVPGAEHGEFGRLAAAFNMMAGTLAAGRQESRDLNASLEARVVERTEALSQSNDRLLIEIAERARTDAALRQSQKLRAVGHLASGMAHEFNNLLTTVLGALELLRLRLGPAHALQRLIDSAQEAASRGGVLTSQLLAFSRRRSVITTTVDLNAVVTEMKALLEGTVGRATTLRIDLAPDIWPVLADRHEVEAAILNLTLNARDALRQGGTLAIATRNTGLPDDARAEAVVLSVQDDGIGMDEHDLSHAIDPFFTTKSVGDGAGLGLSQVHGLAQLLGGALRIDSMPGHGTHVRLFLPRAVAAGAAAGDAVSPVCSGALLLVDDDAQVRQIAAAMLEEIGYDVVQADNAARALELLRADPARFVAVVSDHAMPGMSGADLIRTVRISWPWITPLLITGYMEVDDDAAPLPEPRHVLRKPFTLHDLEQRLHELGRSAARQTA